MSELAEIFDSLGTEIIPDIASIVFPDTMDIIREVTAPDGGGGKRKATTKIVNLDPIPCVYMPRNVRGLKGIDGDAIVSHTAYVVKFQTTEQGELLDVHIADRLRVYERGINPEKTFRVLSLPNKAGVIYEADCEQA